MPTMITITTSQNFITYLPTKTQDSIPIISFLQEYKISVRAKCASWYTGNDVIAQISKGMKVGMKGVIVKFFEFTYRY